MPVDLALPSLTRFSLPTEFNIAWADPRAASPSVVIAAALVGLAVGAILVAIVAYRGDDRRRRAVRRLVANDPGARVLGEGWRDVGVDGHGDEAVPAQVAYSPVRLPRWLQLASVVIALGVTWFVAQRVVPSRDKGRAEEANGALSDSGAHGAAAAAETTPGEGDSVPFAFRAREWTDSGGSCSGKLVVTRGTAAPWSLTMAVHDEHGRRLDTAHTRVDGLRPGEVVQFRFTRATCDQISAWEVRGETRAR